MMAEMAAATAWRQRGANPLEGGEGSQHNNLVEILFFIHDKKFVNPTISRGLRNTGV
jgi:hypothetical protein